MVTRVVLLSEGEEDSEGVSEEGEDGGVISTPLLVRWLFIKGKDIVSAGWTRESKSERDIRINSRNRPSQLSLSFLLLLESIGVSVNAPGLLKGGNTAAHVSCATGKFVVRGKHGPVKSVLERHETVDCADCCLLEER